MSTGHLPRSYAAWGQPDFTPIFKQELVALGASGLPLQQGLRQSSYALDHHLLVSILSVRVAGQERCVRAGLHYTGVIAGCNCADDPSPVDELTEYCEVEVILLAPDGQATIRLIEDS